MAARILVVDDDLNTVSFLTEILESEGHEVLVARSGTEAVTVFRDEMPDLVFLDMLLPGRSGVEVCDELRSTFAGLVTPIVFMTGLYKRDSKVAMMKAHGLVDYLIKPMSVDKVRSLSRWQLGRMSDEEPAVGPEPELDDVDLEPDAPGVVDLADGGLCRLLAQVGRDGLTGTIFVAHGNLRRALMFAEGRLVAVRSNGRADRFDRMLARMRCVTSTELSAVREAGEELSDEELAARLRQGGLLDEQSDRRIRLYQALSVAMDSIGRSVGHGRFALGALLTDETVNPRVPARSVLMLGLRRSRRHDDRFTKQLPEELILAPTELGESELDVDLTRIERDVLTLAKQGRPLSDALRVGRLAQLDLAPAVTTLLAAGLLEGSPPPEPELADWPQVGDSQPCRAGSLERNGLPSLIGRIVRERLSGILHLDSREKRSLTFLDGTLVFASSKQPNEKFARVLMENHPAPKESLSRALEEQLHATRHLRIGAILVRKSMLSLTELESLLRMQVERIWARVFREPPTGFRFVEEDLLDEDRVLLDRSMTQLLREGISELPQGALTADPSNAGLHLVAVAGIEPEAWPGLEQTEIRLLRELLASAEGLSAASLGDDSGSLRATELLVALGAVQVASPKPVAVEAEAPDGEADLVREEAAVPTPEFEPARLQRSAPPATVAPAPTACGADRVADFLEPFRTGLLELLSRSQADLAAAHLELGTLRERLRRLEEEQPSSAPRRASRRPAAKKATAKAKPKPKAAPKDAKPAAKKREERLEPVGS